MKYTVEEAAKLLADRINQPHYVESVIRKCIDEEKVILSEGHFIEALERLNLMAMIINDYLKEHPVIAHLDKADEVDKIVESLTSLYQIVGEELCNKEGRYEPTTRQP